MNAPSNLYARIGAELSTARRRKTESLDEAARRTRIPRRYLEALENDRFAEFEALVYLRGFLQSYCEHLELPFAPLWERLAASISIPTPEEPRLTTPAPEYEKASQRLGWLALALILAGGLWAWRKRSPLASMSAAEALPYAPERTERATAPSTELVAARDGWMRVETEQGIRFEGILPRGATLKLEPGHRMILSSPDPAALRLSIAGERRSLPSPDASGNYRLDLP